MGVIALLAAVFAVVGVVFVVSAEAISDSVRFVLFRDPSILRVFGWAAVLIGVLGCAVAVRQMFRRDAVIEVDQGGLLWRRWSNTVIPWSAIADAQVRTMSGQQFLCLTLTEPDLYSSSSLTGRLAGMNKTMGFGDIAVGVQGTDRPMDELVEAVRRCRRAGSAA